MYILIFICILKQRHSIGDSIHIECADNGTELFVVVDCVCELMGQVFGGAVVVDL